MAIMIPVEDVRWNHDYVGERGNTYGNYIGASRSLERGPQAFLVQKIADSVIEPHFHGVDQFQIFARGGGRIGKAVLEPVTIHYVDSYTPYGPIECGATGLDFFNLRARGYVGGHIMPGARDEMPRKAGRHRVKFCAVGVPGKAESVQRSVLIEPEEDGLCAFCTTAGPGKLFPDDVAAGSGRYELVLAGSLVVDGHPLAKDSLIFSFAGEKLPRRRAGNDGVQVLTVQAPTE